MERSRARLSSAFAVAVEAGLAGKGRPRGGAAEDHVRRDGRLGRRSNPARGRVGPRGYRRQDRGTRRAGEAPPGCHDRLEHLDDPVDRARRCDRRARADGRHSLLEPSAADAARRDRRGRTNEPGDPRRRRALALRRSERSLSTSSEMFRASSGTGFRRRSYGRLCGSSTRVSRLPRQSTGSYGRGWLGGTATRGLRDGRPGRDRFMDAGRSEPVSPAVERD